MKIAKHNGETCTFDVDRHTYTLSGGIVLPSVTTYAKKYFKEFDSEKIATAYALKNDLNKEDVLKMWKDKGDKASEFGTACHLYAEKNILACMNPKPIPPSNSFEENILKKVTEIVSNFKTVGQEVILFSRKLNLAGTTDLLLGKKDTLYICDWKTNEKIRTENKYQKALGMLYTYPDCDAVKYQVQLNLYLKIIKQERYFKEYSKYQLVLFHVQENGVIDIPLQVFPDYILDRL